MSTVALSRLARTLLTQCLSGERPDMTPDALRGYRELVRKGLVTPEGQESPFRLTEEGEARRWEFIPHADGPSEVALELLRRLVGGQRVEVSDDTRSAYRELAAAGIMAPMHTFAGGDESGYRFTEIGWSRRHEWLSGPSKCDPSPEASPALRG